MRGMYYRSRTRLPVTQAPMPPPPPPSMCRFKWYKLVIDEVRAGDHANSTCALSGVRFHDEHGAIMEIQSAANPQGLSPANHSAANLLDAAVDTTWVDTSMGAAKSCEVEFTMEEYGAPASVMMFSGGELAHDPVAYTLLGRATFTGQWQEMSSFVPHQRPDGHREFMVGLR